MLLWVLISLLAVFLAAAFTVVFAVKTFRGGQVWGSLKYFFPVVFFWLAVAGAIFVKPSMVTFPTGEEELVRIRDMVDPASDGAGKTVEEDFEETDPAKEPRWAKITHPLGVVLRSRPADDSDALAGLLVNQLVILKDDPPRDGWVRVRTVERGVSGWIPGKYVTELPREPKTEAEKRAEAEKKAAAEKKSEANKAREIPR